MQSRWISLSLTLAVLLGACADDDTTTESSTSVAATTTAPEPAATTTTALDPGAVPAVASSGCEAATTVTPATNEQIETTSGGDTRTYYRRVPPNATPNQPLPLVLDLHGYSEGSTIHLQMSGLGAFGDQEGFITITPEGTGPVPRWDTAFDSADMAYIGDLLDEAEATLCVDRARVFVTGLSNGAFMTSAIACVYADRVAAVAPIAGVQAVEECEATRPVPLVTFHGTADGFVAFDGGLGPDALDLPAPDGSGGTISDGDLPADVLEGPSVPETVAAWAARNGCGAELDAAELSDTTVEPLGDDIVVHEFDCPADASVRFFEITGGGHTWPGSKFSGNLESIMGVTTFSIDANAQMWNFFTRHPLAGVEHS
jgi:polyhydroxybutyrate depolymerase